MHGVHCYKDIPFLQLELGQQHTYNILATPFNPIYSLGFFVRAIVATQTDDFNIWKLCFDVSKRPLHSLHTRESKSTILQYTNIITQLINASTMRDPSPHPSY